MVQRGTAFHSQRAETSDQSSESPHRKESRDKAAIVAPVPRVRREGHLWPRLKLRRVGQGIPEGLAKAFAKLSTVTEGAVQ